MIFNKIGYNDARYLSLALKNNATLTELNLGHNEIKCNGTKNLASAIKINTITKLKLDYNEIGSKGAAYLSLFALNTNVKLIDLNLRNNVIGYNGTKHLSLMLKNNTILIKLKLSKNGITNKGAEYLSLMLRTNITLTKLILYVNLFGVVGKKHLLSAIDVNTTLIVFRTSCMADYNDIIHAKLEENKRVAQLIDLYKKIYVFEPFIGMQQKLIICQVVWDYMLARDHLFVSCYYTINNNKKIDLFYYYYY